MHGDPQFFPWILALYDRFFDSHVGFGQKNTFPLVGTNLKEIRKSGNFDAEPRMDGLKDKL